MALAEQRWAVVGSEIAELREAHAGSVFGNLIGIHHYVCQSLRVCAFDAHGSEESGVLFQVLCDGPSEV